MVKLMKEDHRVQYFYHPSNIAARKYGHGLTRIATPYFSFLNDEDLDVLLPFFRVRS